MNLLGQQDPARALKREWVKVEAKPFPSLNCRVLGLTLILALELSVFDEDTPAAYERKLVPISRICGSGDVDRKRVVGLGPCDQNLVLRLRERAKKEASRPG